MREHWNLELLGDIFPLMRAGIGSMDQRGPPALDRADAVALDETGEARPARLD